MELPDPLQSRAFVLAIIGAAVVVVGLQLWVWGGVAKYHYQIDPEPVGEEAVTDTLAEMSDSAERTDHVYEFSTLSPQSQAILRDALAADGQRISRYGQGNGAPDVDVPGDVHGPGQSEFYLEYQGSYYHLETAGEVGRVSMGEAFTSLPLVAIGTLLWLVGVVRTRGWRPGAATVVGVGTVVLVNTLGLHRIGLTGSATVVASGLAIFSVATVAAWSVPGYVPRRLGAA